MQFFVFTSAIELNLCFFSHLFFFCVKALELDAITSHHWTVVGVSAVTGNKLLASVDWLLDDIAKRIFTLE